MRMYYATKLTLKFLIYGLAQYITGATHLLWAESLPRAGGFRFLLSGLAYTSGFRTVILYGDVRVLGCVSILVLQSTFAVHMRHSCITAAPVTS